MNNYDNKLIIFIDILGFSNMVYESENDMSKFKAILEVVSDLQKTIVEKYEFEKVHEELMRKKKSISYGQESDRYVNPSKFKYSMFSDSIIITLDFIETQSLVGIVSSLGLLQAKYMAKGKLIRGGITFGKVYHEDSVCFGPGFIRAVDLEKEAKFPRIIIDKGILEGTNLPEWDELTYNFYSSLLSSWLKQDINPLALLDKDSGYYYINPLLTHNSHDYYEDIVEAINSNIRVLIEQKVEQSIIDKWIWMQEDLNRNPKVKSGQVHNKFTKS